MLRWNKSAKRKSKRSIIHYQIELTWLSCFKRLDLLFAGGFSLTIY